MGSTAWLALVQSHRARAGQIRLFLTHQTRGKGLTVHRSASRTGVGREGHRHDSQGFPKRPVTSAIGRSPFPHP